MYSTILVPLDGSKRAEQILPHVEELAKRYEARIVFFRVVEPPSATMEGAAITYVDDFEKLKEEAESYLSGLAADFNKKDIQSSSIVENGRVVEAIIRTAEEEKADLVAIASHGRGGLSRVFYGSVAASLLNRIDRPLLLVRSRES